MSKCINCGYFLNCKKASEEIEYCETYIKRKRDIEIIHIDKEKEE